MKEKWQRWPLLHSAFLWRKIHTESRSWTHRRPTRCHPFHYHIIMVFIIIMTLIIIINILIIIHIIIIIIICTIISIILMKSSKKVQEEKGQQTETVLLNPKVKQEKAGCTTEEAKRTAMQVRMTMDPKSSTVLSVCSFFTSFFYSMFTPKLRNTTN